MLAKLNISIQSSNRYPFRYHKQFIHGISSVSGKEFVTPLDHRWLDQEVMEGLCHQCHQWVPISNTKRKNTMLWFRHAHKCHVYHKVAVRTYGSEKCIVLRYFIV